MGGNQSLGFTAEMAALIRAETESDEYSKFFVTPRARLIYKVFNFLFPEKVKEIFEKRSALSNEIETAIREYKPQQVLELACGSSTFGLEYAQTHHSVIYIETDLQNIADAKNAAIRKILEEKGLKQNPNHKVVKLDILVDDFPEFAKRHLKRDKKTLVVAQGLTSYLNKEAYDTLVTGISNLADYLDNCAYLSHETLDESMTSGPAGRIMRTTISALTRSHSYLHFKGAVELRRYYGKFGFSELKNRKGKSGSYVFLMKK